MAVILVVNMSPLSRATSEMQQPVTCYLLIRVTYHWQQLIGRKSRNVHTPLVFDVSAMTDAVRI